MDLLIDILGWTGSISILAAYGLNSYQKIKSDSLLFYTLNIVGGIFLVLYSVNKGAYPNTFINLVWVIIAIPGVIRLLMNSSPR